jgi:hypothetical protein
MFQLVETLVTRLRLYLLLTFAELKEQWIETKSVLSLLITVNYSAAGQIVMRD